jgi:hypothetical protein
MSESTTTSARSQQIEFFEIADFCPISSSEARPAKTSPARTPKAKASKAKGAVSSSKQSELSERSALVGSLLKTALISELGALTPCSLHWRPSATPAGRSWLVLGMSEPITSEPGHGSSGLTQSKFPTPMASDGMKDGKGGGAGSTYPFRMLLSTPRASDMKAGGHGDTGRMGTVRHQLNKATSASTELDGLGPAGSANPKLPTPRKSDATHGPDFRDRKNGTNLNTYLATPRATDGQRGGRGDVLSQLRGYPSKHAGMALAPTPLKSDYKGSLGVMSKGKEKSPNIPTYLRDQKWAGARALAAILQSHGLTGTAALPVVYCWMMGFPSGWLGRALQSAVQKGHLQQVSSLKRSAMPSSPKSPKPSEGP